MTGRRAIATALLLLWFVTWGTAYRTSSAARARAEAAWSEADGRRDWDNADLYRTMARTEARAMGIAVVSGVGFPLILLAIFEANALARRRKQGQPVGGA